MTPGLVRSSDLNVPIDVVSTQSVILANADCTPTQAPGATPAPQQPGGIACVGACTGARDALCAGRCALAPAVVCDFLDGGVLSQSAARPGPQAAPLFSMWYPAKDSHARASRSQARRRRDVRAARHRRDRQPDRLEP